MVLEWEGSTFKESWFKSVLKSSQGAHNVRGGKILVSSGLKQLRRLLHYLQGCDANLAQVIHTISSGFSLCLWVERYTGWGKCDLHLFPTKVSLLNQILGFWELGKWSQTR